MPLVNDERLFCSSVCRGATNDGIIIEFQFNIEGDEGRHHPDEPGVHGEPERHHPLHPGRVSTGSYRE